MSRSNLSTFASVCTSVWTTEGTSELEELLWLRHQHVTTKVQKLRQRVERLKGISLQPYVKKDGGGSNYTNC